MDHSVNGITSWVFLVFGIIGFVSVAFAYLKASYSKEVIAALRGDRDDLTTRNERLEREMAELESDLSDERTSRAALERVVTGRAELDSLGNALKEHDKTTSRLLSQAVERLDVLSRAATRGTGKD